ncbi:MAG: serine/threonine-protein kinase [Planctomycetota bacterium]|jgi:serine/threonine protein kinase
MTEQEKERLLAESLEEYHRRRALGEAPTAEDYRERLGEHFEEFAELLAAETAIDELLEPPAADDFPLPFGEYTLVGELGRGAMGVVYEAVHRSLGRKVALKVLRTGFDTEPLALERFRREARACAQVRHDNIVQIYEAGQVEGRPYYSMPLLEGRSLSELIREDHVPEPEVLAKGMAGIADPLETLHAAGIVHRDVKPGNIMVEPSGRMILADFGLARTAAAHSLTQTGQALGTPLYMSPEQLLAKAEAIDGRTDVYGLGVTIFEALTGKPPFKADDTTGLMRMILYDRPLPLPDFAPELPEPICHVAMKAMERRRKDRYQTAAALRDDLRAFAEGREVKGRPVSNLRHNVRRLRRYMLPAAAVLLVAVGLAAWSQLRPGKLVLRSIPVALAQIDGEDVGSTPLEVSLPAGKHEILLSLEGFGDKVRTVEIEPGDTSTLDLELVLTSSDDVLAIAKLSQAVGVPFEPYQDLPVMRGAPPGGSGFALLPRGKARLDDLLNFRVELDPELRGDPAGVIQFMKDEKVLAELPFDPEHLTTVDELPQKVLAALKPGDELTWVVKPREGKEVRATVQVVPDELAAQIARIDERLAGQPWVARSHLKAKLYVANGLFQAALDEAKRIVAEQPDSALGWAAVQEALKGLGQENTNLWIEARRKLLRLPAEQRKQIFK